MRFSSGYPGADRTIDIPPGVDRIGETRRAWDVDSVLMFMRPLYDGDRHSFLTGTLDDGLVHDGCKRL